MFSVVPPVFGMCMFRITRRTRRTGPFRHISTRGARAKGVKGAPRRGPAVRILVTGAAGVIGSALCDRFAGDGYSVRGVDVCRLDEAWRLAGSRDRIEYMWKATNDLVRDDLAGVDVAIDCGLGVADRPFGNSSPSYTAAANVLPPLRLLEIAARMGPSSAPVLVYPSSFNTLYGHPPGSKYTAGMQPLPSSLYGWTKAAVELLYASYHRSHGVRCVVTRVGSGYGARMRSDEFPARLILDALRGRSAAVRSPGAKRLWTYGEDVVEFYSRLVAEAAEYDGQTLHCAGNADGRIVDNMELARLVRKIGGGDAEIVPGEYEPGEIVDGRPISFEIEGGAPLWSPRFTLEEGMRRTFAWFGENLARYA